MGQNLQEVRETGTPCRSLSDVLLLEQAKEDRNDVPNGAPDLPGEDHTAHLKGIPFFRSQSLDHPLPRTEEELTECLDEMIKRIRVRACRLSGIPD